MILIHSRDSLISERLITQPFTNDVFQNKRTFESHDKITSFLTLLKFYESIKKVNTKEGVQQEQNADIKIDNTKETISKEPGKSKNNTKRSSSDRTAVAADYSLKITNKKHFSDF